MLVMPVIREDQDQIRRRKRWEALDALAREAGFDEMALHETEFCLMSFFDKIIEECAKIAEAQGRTHSNGDGPSACYNAARAIRNYGATLGNEP